MPWISFSWALFLMGILNALVSSSIGINYRKNGVLNLGHTGLMYIGYIISGVFGKLLRISPYWGILVCILVGGIVNFAVNLVYLEFLKRGHSRNYVTGASFLTVFLLYLVGKGTWELLRSQYTHGFAPIFNDWDFTLFTAPGILITSVAIFFTSFLLNFVLQPIVDGRRSNVLDKWDVLVYSISGVFSCVAGALFPFWFMFNWVHVLIMPIAGVLFGGLDKKLNPFLGGFFSSTLTLWLVYQGQTTIGPSVDNYMLVIPLVLMCISLPLFPKGIIGKIRSILEYNY